MADQNIPLVNLEDYRSGDATRREHFIKTLGDALNSLGFFAIENHGVDLSVIQRSYAAINGFFLKDDTFKDAYEKDELKGQRGFISFGREHAKDSNAPDLKEFWHVGRELPQGHPLLSKFGSNVWPDIPDFKEAMLALYTQLEECAMTLLEAIGYYLDIDHALLPSMAKDGDTILRAIHYPPIPDDKNPASVRAAAHEDINFITLLCEATAPGLELLQHDGTWRPIHALGGQIVVDSGDMLQNLTNGLLKSTTHRVTNPGNDRDRRFSIPFFVHPRGEVDLTPMKNCVERSGGESKYPSWTAEEFLDQRLREIGLTK